MKKQNKKQTKTNAHKTLEQARFPLSSFSDLDAEHLSMGGGGESINTPHHLNIVYIFLSIILCDTSKASENLTFILKKV